MTHFSSVVELQNIAELQGLVADLAMFTQKLSQFRQRLNLDFDKYQADHISLRCHDMDVAERWRKGFLQCGSLMSESIINGRPICLFDLAQPITVLNWQIDCVELPYPGKKAYAHQGWEHVELVLPVAPEMLLAEARALLPQPLPTGFSVKESQPKGEQERLPNPTLAITDGEITVKFHPFTLRDIVKSEHQSAKLTFPSL
ncbi:VOC family protein [Photorhabdus stackebrandtii]|uniref:VOC family protein n=1 Tax=Photorhabdus stackebrandtii TaxID=1123042 RepID=A0A7X5QN99_9GAMM|nr:VOC family protein [Photorhabdus stackebrandtii]NHB97465.1 VOC family protein [Photorhabdus stackebrandtii]